ncbi:MAG: amidohydrolase family protein [Bacteroidia bacterium]|nr:amidohydrolase family protein [Bacteroidia bacterium]
MNKRLQSVNKFIVAFFLAFLFFECTAPSVFFEDALCIENISTIDPVVGLKEHQTLIIKDGKILRIASTSDLKLSKKNTIQDGAGKYLMPGLWDAHIHFGYIEALAPSMFDLFIAYGITSVRDTGGRLEFVKYWKDLALANPTDAPRVMIAGPLLDGMPNVYDGSDAEHPPLSVGLPTVYDVSKQVSMLDSAGVDFLKAYEMLTPEQFAVITKYANENKLKVSGHVPLSMDVISASNGGLNSMEHLRNLELSCATNSKELLAQRLQLLNDGRKDPGGKLRSSIHQAQRQTAIENYDEQKANEILNVFAKNQTWQIPTLTLYTVFITKPFMQDQWQKSFTYLPDSISQVWNASIEKVMNSEVPTFSRQYSKWMSAMVGKINRAGIGIMAGTDTPIGYLTPGLSLHEELELLVSSGLTPLEAIETATLNPARYFNLENEVGSIKETMWADLLILDANPLESIGNTKRINAVIKQGKMYDRAKLDQVLGRLAQK